MGGWRSGRALINVRIGLDLSLQELPEPTGVERAQASLIEGLLAADVDHEFVLFAHETLPDRWREAAGVRAGVSVVEGPPRPLWFWRESVVPRALREQKVELFHSPVSAIPLRARCPLLATVHEVPWAEEAGAEGDQAASHRLRLHLAANFAARLLCVSERTAEQVRRLHPDSSDRIRVIPNGLSSTWPTAPIGSSPGQAPDLIETPFVLAVGRLRKKKNLMRLLDAFALRLGAGGSEQLVLAGPEGDASDALRARAAQADLAGHVVFTGYVDDRSLAQLYSDAACLAYPSLFEGFGLPVLEAMSVGAPVLVSRQGAIPEAGGDAVLAVDGEDVAALHQGLSRLLEDAQLTEALRAAGNEQVQQCSIQRAVRAVLDVYAELA